MCEENRRIGKFFVSDALVYRDSFPLVLARIGFVPLRVEHLMHEVRFEYIGLSFMFKPIVIGSEIPKYEVIIDESGDELSIFVQPLRKKVA